MRPTRSWRVMVPPSNDLELGAGAEIFQMGAAEFGVGERMGLARVLLGFLDQPAAIAGAREYGEQRFVVDDSVARRREQAFEHGSRKTHIPAPTGGECVAAN